MGNHADALRRRLLAAVATSSVVAVACGGNTTETASSSSGVTSSSSSGASGSTSSGSVAPTCDRALTRTCVGGGVVRKGSFSQIPDAAPAELPPPVIDSATGCMVQEEVMDGCCNGAVGGPFLDGSSCCYDFCEGSCCGRPVRIDGVPVVAPIVANAEWSSPDRIDVSALDAITRAELCASYTRDAQTEHASIASFSIFALELLAVGAPPDLVAGAHAAALDEVAHAEVTFAIASAFHGSKLGPAPLRTAGMRAKDDLAAIAVDCVRDGCIGETIASLVAAEQARRAKVPAIRAALEKIAEDEARHAELAWRFARWAISTGGSHVRQAILGAFEAPPPEGVTVPTGVDPLAWEAHGRLSASDFAETARDAMRSVIEPCVRVVMGQNGRSD